MVPDCSQCCSGPSAFVRAGGDDAPGFPIRQPVVTVPSPVPRPEPVLSLFLPRVCQDRSSKFSDETTGPAFTPRSDSNPPATEQSDDKRPLRRAGNCWISPGKLHATSSPVALSRLDKITDFD